jgi:hypothetical protein
VKVVSQRKTRAVNHHHPLRSLAPLGLAHGGAPFFAGAKLPSRKDSLQFIGWRSLRSPRLGEQGPNLFPLGVGQQPTVSRHRPSLWRQLLSRASPRQNNYLNSNPLYRVLKWLLELCKDARAFLRTAFLHDTNVLSGIVEGGAGTGNGKTGDDCVPCPSR